MRYRKKPVVIEAHQWFRNGDHPDDRIGEYLADPITDKEFVRNEGAVVRYYRHPDVDGQAIHGGLPDTKRPGCSHRMDDHGWIDTIEGGHTVCPSDFIITGIQDERYPCELSIFEATHEREEDA